MHNESAMTAEVLKSPDMGNLQQIPCIHLDIVGPAQERETTSAPEPLTNSSAIRDSLAKIRRPRLHI